MIKKIWKDPVWSKLIVLLFVALAGVISNHYIDWWNSCKSFISNFYIYLRETSEIQNWILILVSLIASLFILLILMKLLYKIFVKKQEEKPSYQNYLSDTFFNIKWHWKQDVWGMGVEPIYDMYTLCSNCEYQIYPQEKLDAYNPGKYTVSFYCEHCNTTYKDIPFSFNELKHKVILKIQHKLRTGTWKNKP